MHDWPLVIGVVYEVSSIFAAATYYDSPGLGGLFGPPAEKTVCGLGTYGPDDSPGPEATSGMDLA